MGKAMANNEKTTNFDIELLSTNCVVLIFKEMENIDDFKCGINVIPWKQF